MARIKEIQITIDDEGNATVNLNGFEGPACEGIQKYFDELGTKVLDRKKPEFTRNTAVTSVRVKR